MNCLILLITLGLNWIAGAAVVSNSGEEIEYKFEVTFKSRHESALTKTEAKAEAEFHSAHVDGLFHSKEYPEKFGVSTELTEGFGGSKYPSVIEVSSVLAQDGHVWITYTATAHAMVLKKVVKGWIGNSDSGTVQLPMPTDLTLIYNDNLDGYSNRKWEKCTDEHYTTAGDFYYFYDPFRCLELGKAPVGEMVTFKIKRLAQGSKTAKVPKAELRGDNGNGRLQTFYFAYGFDEIEPGAGADAIKKDYGWAQFAGLTELLEGQGFSRMESTSDLATALGSDGAKLNTLTPVVMDNPTQRRFFNTFVKKDGEVTYVVRAGLFPTENWETREPLVSFPKFWKEAWENGDFIYYGGHSGMGHHLSLDVMLQNLSTHDMDGIEFKRGKTQVVFFDSCSSYAHFQDMYQSRKKAGLYAISYGVVSLFHLAPAAVETMINVLMGVQAPTWADTMEKVEHAQLRPAVEFSWAKKDVDYMIDYFESDKQYPAFLLNVSLPD